MYGMIHRAIREMVIDLKGRDAWSEVERCANCGPAELISSEVYSDQITLDILSKSADILEIDYDEMMQKFGYFWIDFSNSGPFRGIMNFSGRSLEVFINNLNKLHNGVQTVLVQSSMPSFDILAVRDGFIAVRYRSKRSGLDSFVIGLFEGLLRHFSLKGRVHLVEKNVDHSIFEINYVCE